VFEKVTVSSWVAISDGCPIHCEVGGSGVAHFVCGELPDGFEFQIDSEALREFVRQGADALRDMDSRYECEETERLSPPEPESAPST